jgi:hypothetical protein
MVRTLYPGVELKQRGPKIMIEIKQETKLIELNKETREWLAEVDVRCEACNFPLSQLAPDHGDYTLTRIQVIGHPERKDWEEGFACCDEECYIVADSIIEKRITRRCQGEMIAIVEQWNGDEE